MDVLSWYMPAATEDIHGKSVTVAVSRLRFDTTSPEYKWTALHQRNNNKEITGSEEPEITKQVTDRMEIKTKRKR
jgi:hypothetical protein